MICIKLDRLIGILTVLLQNERITAPELAKKFEVSRRTISRDIETLCMAGIPIATQQGSGGGIYIVEGYKLDKSILTSDELSGIISAVKGLGSVSESSMIENTLNKLSVGNESVVSLREPIIIDLANYYKDSLTKKISQIKKAVLENKLIEFDYFYSKGENRRIIEPYYIIFQWSSWYVFGFCLERNDWRTFKLQRLWNLKTLDTRFSPRQIPDERPSESAYDDEIKLVALFEPSEKYLLIDTYGPGCYTETPEGFLKLEIGFTNRSFMISWILSFGNKVQVIEPHELSDEIMSIAEKTVSLYKRT